MNRILAEDHVDVSRLTALIDSAKDCSTPVIEHVIAELEHELQERDSNYVKSMERELLT